jgi:hypothetical protein
MSAAPSGHPDDQAFAERRSRTRIARVSSIVEYDVTANPLQTGLLHTAGHVTRAHLPARYIEKGTSSTPAVYLRRHFGRLSSGGHQ